jgi:hypothetical protein
MKCPSFQITQLVCEAKPGRYRGRRTSTKPTNQLCIYGVL